MKRRDRSPVTLETGRVELKKADDWSRRAFLQRASLFLTAFGLSWTHRMDILGGLSKRILGNPYAFAAGPEPLAGIFCAFRSGYPIDNSVFATANDASAGTTNTRRTIHWNPTATQVFTPAPGNGRPLYLAPQMAGFAASPLAAKTAVLTSVRSTNGHMPTPDAFHLDGSGFIMNHLAARNAGAASPAILNSTFVFGSDDEFSANALGGLSPEYAPTYIRARGQVQALFSQLNLRSADGLTFDSTLNREVLGVLNTEFNATFLEAIASRPGGQVIASNAETLQKVLATNLAQILTPSQNEIDAIVNGTGGAAAGAPAGANTATAPDNNSMSIDSIYGSAADDIAEVFATIGLLIKNGVTFQAQVNLPTGDWHGENEAFSGTAGDAGNGTNRADHAAFWDRFLVNLFDAYSTRDVYKNVPGTGGKSVGDIVRMAWGSEFTRTVLMGANGTDHGDSGKQSILMIGPGIKAGTYGNVDGQGRQVRPDPATGDDAGVGQLEPAYIFNTLAKFFDVDPEGAGVSRGNRDKRVTAIVG